MLYVFECIAFDSVGEPICRQKFSFLYSMVCAIPKEIDIPVGYFLRDGRHVFLHRSSQLSSVEQTKSKSVDRQYAAPVVYCFGALLSLDVVSCWFRYAYLSDSCWSPICTCCFGLILACLTYLSDAEDF
jgi:hypothetical protein